MRWACVVAVLGLCVAACGDDGGAPDGSVDSGFDSGDAGCVGSDCCTDSAMCDDGLHCNGVEMCVASRCAAGQPIACDDDIACTVDSCSESLRACEFVTPDVDEDGHGDATCLDNDNQPLGDDCDDNDVARYPGNLEVCVPGEASAARDEDCDPTTFGELDADGDGAVDDRCVNVDAVGVEHRGFDCDDANMARRRGQQEFCDQRDNDCDGTVDEDPGVVAWYADEDEDGVGGATLVIETCTLQPTLSLRNTDCDDNDPARRTGFPEFCDGIDNNCNSVIDERLTNCGTAATETTKTINECFNGLSNCDVNAICTDTLDGFSCACGSGYIGDGLTCADIADCATNNGGCDILATCNEGLGVPNTCSCPSGYLTSDNGMTCTDPDECLINNGECGDATYFTCSNNIGDPPTCSDIDECATNNGGCDALTTCANNIGAVATCGACPDGTYGDGRTGCNTYPASCKALLDAGQTTSGTYLIDPDRSGPMPEFQAHCDLTGAGGGWTLIRSSVSGGTNASVEGLPTPATNSHLSPTRMMAIAAISEQVHIRTSGNPTDSITSGVGTPPILGMRAGVRMYSGYDANCEYHPMADWTGASNRLAHQYTCCPQVSDYPNGVFHSCNYAGGLGWFGAYNGWTFGATHNLEMYFR